MPLLGGRNTSTLTQEALWDCHFVCDVYPRKRVLVLIYGETLNIALFINFIVISRAYHSLFGRTLSIWHILENWGYEIQQYGI